MASPDRKNALLAQAALTGIDFVAVAKTQVELDVFFLRAPLGLTAPLGDLTAPQVKITGDEDPHVPVTGISWQVVDNRDVLRIVTARPGGFGRYRLRLADARIDPFFNDVEFSFKAACPSDFDCKTPEHECPPDLLEDVVVDGTARDFWSLRRALLDFASQRHPRWKDRLEADVGVMLVELMSALGDEMAYYQDRVARETHFATASQRRSLRRHARLVDYHLHDGLGARAWLAVKVASGSHLLLGGTDVWAQGDGGKKVGFEVGTGLAESMAKKPYPVKAARNRIPAHLWDETAMCLPIGATSIHVKDHHAADFAIGDPVILVVDPPDPSRPPMRWLVHLTAIKDETDPLLPLGTGTKVTRLSWSEDDAPPFELDLEFTAVLGNVVPVSAGLTQVVDFSIGESVEEVPEAVERQGRDGSVSYLFTLPDRGGQGLVWHGAEPRTALPEVHLAEISLPGQVLGEEWSWKRALLGTDSSLPSDRHFTLDDGTWDRAVGYRRIGKEIVHVDYLAGIGTTLRFGDGEFGRMPARGNPKPGEGRFFRVTFRLGNGSRGNVAAGAIRFIDPAVGFVESVTNPLPSEGGIDPEDPAIARRDAPDEFRAITFRAVRPEDYAEAARRLAWVQNAGARNRWTGSWLTTFVTADPRGSSTLEPAQRRALGLHLDRFRQAGREMHVVPPRYVDLDLIMKICVERSAYPADVELAVLRALTGRRGRRREIGFFHPDRFTFGTPLDRSELETAIQNVPGVKAVEGIAFRRRGHFDWKLLRDPYFTPGDHEVIRIDNDPLHPDRGTIRIITDGGA